MDDLTRGEPPQIHPPVRYCRVLHGSNMLTNAGSNKLDLLMKSSTRTRLRARSPRSRCAWRRAAAPVEAQLSPAAAQPALLHERAPAGERRLAVVIAACSVCLLLITFATTHMKFVLFDEFESKLLFIGVRMEEGVGLEG